MTESKHPPIYASVKNSNIEAIIASAFRFESEEQAKKKLEALKTMFIKPSKQINHPNKSVLILWIDGYDVTKEEKEKGCIGNFAAITYKVINGVEGGGKQIYTIRNKNVGRVKISPTKKASKITSPELGASNSSLGKAKKEI